MEEFLRKEIVWECFEKICQHRDEVIFITRNNQVTSVKRNLLRFSSPLFNNILGSILHSNQDTVHLPQVKKITLDKLFDLLKEGVTTSTAGDTPDQEIDEIKATAEMLGFRGLDSSSASLDRVPAREVLGEGDLDHVVEPIDYSMKEPVEHMLDLVIKLEMEEEKEDTHTASVPLQFVDSLLKSYSITAQENGNGNSLELCREEKSGVKEISSSVSVGQDLDVPAISLPPTLEFSPPKERESPGESEREKEDVTGNVTPLSTRPEFHCLYERSACVLCGTHHRKIDACRGETHCKCNTAHSSFKDCHGYWLPIDKFEQAALKVIEKDQNSKKMEKNVKKDHKIDDKLPGKVKSGNYSERSRSKETNRAKGRKRGFERISEFGNRSSSNRSEGDGSGGLRRALFPKSEPDRRPSGGGDRGGKRRALLPKPERQWRVEEVSGPPVSGLPQLQYIYEYNYHKLCGEPHRRIDVCPAAPAHELCGKRHSFGMDCSGVWMSVAKFESLASGWPTSKKIAERMAKENMEREERKRRRHPKDDCCLDWNFGTCDEISCKRRHRCSFIKDNGDYQPCLGRHKAKEHRNDPHYAWRR